MLRGTFPEKLTSTMNKMFFQMYNCIIPVKGHLRSILCDLQRKDFVFVSNDFVDLFNKSMNFDISAVSSQMTSTQQVALNELIEELESKEYGFMSESGTENFSTPKSGFDNYLWIDAIIDFDRDSKHSLSAIVPKLNQLFFPHLKIRFLAIDDLGFVIAQLRSLDDSTIRSVELLFGEMCSLDLGEIISAVSSFPRVAKIIYSDKNCDALEEYDSIHVHVIRTPQPLSSPSCCGQVGPEYFTINSLSYFVNDQYNSCLYGKVAIAANGDIKNCPSMLESYGNIQDINLLEVLEDETFRRTTMISKNEINICKDCEFRLICPDCRAFTEKDGRYDKPAKCRYDPYNAIWH